MSTTQNENFSAFPCTSSEIEPAFYPDDLSLGQLYTLDIPPTNITFYGFDFNCKEVIHKADITYPPKQQKNYQFFTNFSYSDFASDQPRPLASMLDSVLAEIDALIAQPLPPLAETFDLPRARKNVYLLKDYIKKLESDPKCAAERFIFLQQELDFFAPFYFFPDHSLYDDVNHKILHADDVLRSEYEIKSFETDEKTGETKEILRIYSPTAMEPSTVIRNGVKYRIFPYCYLGRTYLISNLWQYCLALCEYLSFSQSLHIRLRCCDNCGRFYLKPYAVPNSRYCSRDCSEERKSILSEQAAIYRKICQRLNRRTRPGSAKVKAAFHQKNDAFQQAIKEKRCTDEEYLAWLKAQNDTLLILRRKK